MAETNPNGANQHTPDPRQEKCWEVYVESIRKGVPNAYQSAIDAGYEETSAKDITATGWFLERLDKLRRKEMASKAERNLDRMLDTDWDKDGKVQPEIMRIVADVSKTVSKSLLKEIWSERIENTGAEGKDLFPVPIMSGVYVQSNNSNIEGNGNAEENPGSAGGDISE